MITALHHIFDFVGIVCVVAVPLFLFYGCIGVLHEWASARVTTRQPTRVVPFPSKETSWL